jgi:hypothetical protein
MGGDVAGKGDAGSPGSGGASPYLRRGFPCSLAGQCHPPKLSVDYLTTTQERRIIRVADRASDNAQGPRKSWSTLTTNLEPVPKTRFFRETHVARRGIAKICNLKRYLLALLCVLGLKPAI